VSGKLGDSRTMRGKRTRLIFPASGLANEMARERLTRTYFARPWGRQWVGFPRGAFCRPSTDALADADLADIYSSGKGQRSLLHAECRANLGPEKHEISDGKRRHHKTKATYQNVADGRTELRSARLFCCLDDLAVFLFPHLVLAACSITTPHRSARATCNVGVCSDTIRRRIILSPAHILADHALGAPHTLVASGLLVGRPLSRR
jgi:hypothetical protein